MAPFHILAKPAGPKCNLDCEYCFYLEKEALFQNELNWKMDDTTLENFVKAYIEGQPGGVIPFAFQGGEPTLMGVDFFRRVIELQKKHAGGREIQNSLQTNGTRLTDEWGEFLAENRFLVGISIDGPADLHDKRRVDNLGRGTHERAVAGSRVLVKHGVEFNILACVNADTAREPERVYDFLTSLGTNWLQFIPIVERRSDPLADDLDLKLCSPPRLTGGSPQGEAHPPLTEWSVKPEDLGSFLVRIFERWVKRDPGRVYVQIIEFALARHMGVPAGMCVFDETCGRALALEHNGDVYQCDHFVYPQYKLGNVNRTPLSQLADSTAAWRFGQEKRDSLPRQCRECEVRRFCNGDCPKHRFCRTEDGEWGLSYLCPAYRRFFKHIQPALDFMGEQLDRQQPPAAVRQFWRRRKQQRPRPGGRRKRSKGRRR